MSTRTTGTVPGTTVHTVAARPASTRTAVLWVPDWPVLAAMEAGQVESHRPAAVHDGRRLTAVSAVARAQGVRRGMRRRQAQACCPDIVMLPTDEGRDVRSFEAVAIAAERVVAGVEVSRPGLLLLPAGGASRYHGGEQALAERLVGEVVEHTGHECQVGVADGLLAAILAARGGLVVAPGLSPSFLAGRDVTDLAHATTQDAESAQVADLVDLLRRLGMRTLGDLAALPAADVAARFGQRGAWAHLLAGGGDLRPPARRRPEADVEVGCELDPPATRVDEATFAGRRLAEQLHDQLVERSASCGRLRITARTDTGEELVRTWRTDLGGLGGLTANRITDRIRWQLDGWLTAGALRPHGDSTHPVPAALVHLAVAAEDVGPAGAEQGRLWGGPSGGDLRARRALLRVQGLLGGEGVLTATVQGGRGPGDQVHLAPWAEATQVARPVDRPWPGRLPQPAPSTVYREPEPVQVVDADGVPVRIDVRLAMSGAPARVRLSPPRRPGAARHGREEEGPGEGGREGRTERYEPSTTEPEVGRDVAVVGWAGPWPSVERWWSRTPQRRVYLQVSLEDGTALLLAQRDGSWGCEARYD
jgi:protein ImuB